MFSMNSVQVPQMKVLTAVPRGARTRVFFLGSTEGPDADIPPYADILSISGSGSDDEDATDVQKLDAAQPDKPEICF